ncbi:MAG: WD40 repeat domain-containing protein [Anaerolineales bacterium]|nr:WD40 repeat domain-containing protein [Anaerolineales bacterium]
MKLTHAQAQAFLEQTPGHLRPAEFAALQQHLDECETCRAFRTAVRERDHLIHQTLHLAHPRPSFTQAELQRISTRVRRRAQTRRFLTWLGGGIQTLTWTGLTAGLAFGLIWLLNHLPLPNPEPAATEAVQVTAPVEFTRPSVEPTPLPTLAAPSVTFTAQFEQTLHGHETSVAQVAFSPDGQWLASADTSGVVNLWDAEAGQLVYSLTAHPKAITSLAFAPDGSMFATGSKDGTVNLWDTESGRLLNSLLDDTSPVKSLAFSPNGELLAVSMSQYQVYIIRVATGLMINSSSAHTRFDVSTDTNNNYVLASSETAVWLNSDSTVPFAIILRGQGGRALNTALSPDGKLLASGSTDQKIYLWQIFDVSYIVHNEYNALSTTERLVSGPLKLTLEGHTGWVTSLAFAPAEMIVSGSTDGTVKIWSLADGSLLTTLTGHQAGVNSVAVSPDGHSIASASDDGTVNLWNFSP